MINYYVFVIIHFIWISQPCNAPKIKSLIQEINDRLYSLFLGEEKMHGLYANQSSFDETLSSHDVLSRLKTSHLSNNKLILKRDVLVMLLKNTAKKNVSCNKTRL